MLKRTFTELRCLIPCRSRNRHFHLFKPFGLFIWLEKENSLFGGLSLNTTSNKSQIRIKTNPFRISCCIRDKVLRRSMSTERRSRAQIENKSAKNKLTGELLNQLISDFVDQKTQEISSSACFFGELKRIKVC